MLVICEECAKKYEIDETKIKSEKAYFACRKCSHQIVVEKPRGKAARQPEFSKKIEKQEQEQRAAVSEATVVIEPPKTESEPKSQAAPVHVRKKEKGRGLPLGFYFILPLVLGFLTVNGAFFYFYFMQVPQLLHKQVRLRADTIADTFRYLVQEPLRQGDLAAVKREAEKIAAQPDVAYIAIVDKNGGLVTSVFGEMNRFNLEFYAKAKSSGFPVRLLQSNGLGKNKLVQKDEVIRMGGQDVHDKVMVLPVIQGELHVGMFLGSFRQSMNEALLSPIFLGIVTLVWLLGLLAFIMLIRYIKTPLEELTDIVDRISLGELDLAINIDGPREVREFARAFERMRFSIREAINRLKR